MSNRYNNNRMSRWIACNLIKQCFEMKKGRVFVNCFRALVDVMFSVYHTQMACLILVAAEQKLAFKTILRLFC